MVLPARGWGIRRVVPVVLLLLILVGTLCFLYQRHRDRPRRECLGAITALSEALTEGRSDRVAASIALPLAQVARTPQEQAEFASQALRDEVTADGVRWLARHGRFGSLNDLFPGEGATWACQAGVAATNCLAFKAERDGLPVVAVLTRSGAAYRLVRIDNVR